MVAAWYGFKEGNLWLSVLEAATPITPDSTRGHLLRFWIPTKIAAEKMVQPAHLILTDKKHLPTLDQAPTGGGTNALGTAGVAPGDGRPRRHKPSLAVSPSEQWPREMSGTLMNWALASPHFLSITTLTSPSQQSNTCIKTQLDHRRYFTLRSLFPAAE